MTTKNFNEVKVEGDLEFIKPKELETLGAVEGTFLEIVQSTIEGYQPGYKFEKDDGGLFVVNGCASLNRKMTEVTAGSLVRLEHRGRKPSKKGQDYHDIAVLVADA